MEYRSTAGPAVGHPDRASDAVKAAVFPRYEKARAGFRDQSRSERPFWVDIVEKGLVIFGEQ